MSGAKTPTATSSSTKASGRRQRAPVGRRRRCDERGDHQARSRGIDASMRTTSASRLPIVVMALPMITQALTSA